MKSKNVRIDRRILFKKTGNILRNVKNCDFWPHLHIIMTLPWQRKRNHGHMVNMSKFPQGMNEQLLKKNAFFKIAKKPLGVTFSLFF